jgi:transposase
MKKFTTEFKLECVKLTTIQGYPVKQAAESMNVGYSTLQKWLRQF